MGFIYLIKLTKYENQNVYKIGMTEQVKLIMRLNGYGKGGIDYVIEYFIEVEFATVTEKEIIKIFKDHFYLFKGREYFMGNCNEMINIIKPFQFTLKQKELRELELQRLEEKRNITLKDYSKKRLIDIIDIYHRNFETIKKYSKFEIFSQQGCTYFMNGDYMVWSLIPKEEEEGMIK